MLKLFKVGDPTNSPNGLCGSAIMEQQKQAGRPYDGKLYERHDAKSIKVGYLSFSSLYFYVIKPFDVANLVDSICSNPYDRPGLSFSRLGPYFSAHALH